MDDNGGAGAVPSDSTDISALLSNWNIPADVIETFIRNKINTTHLSKLTDTTLKELCPVLGIRLELKERIDSYVNANADTVTLSTDQSTLINLSTDQSTLINLPVYNIPETENLNDVTIENISLLNVSDLFESDSSTSIVDFDLKTLLQTSPLGKSVLNYYAAYGKLDMTRRNRLTDVIGRHFYTLAVNRKITYNDYNTLAAKIVVLFPTENIGTYFVRPIPKHKSKTGRSQFARGKLIDKIRNLLYKSEDRKRPSTSAIDPQILSKSQRIEDTDDIIWLRTNNEPWETVIEKWNNTYSARLNAKYENVAEFVQLWPILNDLRSDVLINLDFDKLHPQRISNFYKNWSAFFEKVRSYKRESLSDASAKLLDEALGTDISQTNEDLDNKLPSQLKLLGYLVPPKGRIGKKWKFSTAEAIEGIMVHVKQPGQVDETINEQKQKALKKKQHVQPYLLLQGPTLDNIKGRFIVVDKIMYSFTSTSKAVDTLFKLYHAFYCVYPAPSEHLYLLIQRSVYNIETPYDNVMPYMIDLYNLK